MPGGKPIRERRHRLPIDAYRGTVVVAFTACAKRRTAVFTEPAVVRPQIDILQRSCADNDCALLAYCFMPDHLHAVLEGRTAAAHTWKAFVGFKQMSGRWLTIHRPGVVWQKDFYDHVFRTEEDLRRHVRYIMENPVRGGLATDWRDYPFTGVFGETVPPEGEGAG
jgi:putative transposase